MDPINSLLRPPSSNVQQLHSQSRSQPKPLRFVTNYGAPRAKRRRIGAACLTCRKRKTACSGEQPFCETCKQNNLDCAGYTFGTGTSAHKRAASDSGPARLSHHNGSQEAEFSRKSPIASRAEPNGKNEAPRVESGAQSPRAALRTRRSTEGSKNGERNPGSLFSGAPNRMPYFRWLGPTAIMPGFKQMVVKVKRQDTDVPRSSTDGGGVRSPSQGTIPAGEQRAPAIYSNAPIAVESDVRTPLNLPFYDNSPMPPSELITHLCNTFFTHLGCNYPFLQRKRFLKDLEEKQVDAILVDAVCALAARFSTHSLLTQSATGGDTTSPAEYGHAFGQRAKTALTDTFAMPTVAAAQAALLLAYNEFGEQRDSGLWMYLGISIRLAQDLGLHKLEGLQYIGKDGPTPKTVKRQSRSAALGESPLAVDDVAPAQHPKLIGDSKRLEMDETIAVEQERVDTFWAILFLDRVVSSGVGRRCGLRDKDIELSFPSLSQTSDDSTWPAPFPALIRIIHLYGRVADLLNSIKEPSDITTETPKRLAAMERQVTDFYQNLSSRLHFDAVNFQHYMKAGEGTNFVLLHFWFHTLIVLLHQPTLLKTFEGPMLQLFPNSRQLSISSAKTIADILSYSQLMDAKAPLGNPFTTQPIYIAACAFLRETIEQTATSNSQSRASTPGRSRDTASESNSSINGHHSSATFRKASISAITTHDSPTSKPTSSSFSDQKTHSAKHTLLATAATQHYQLCYKALQSLETYWAGTKYILTVLNQKFEGVGDPLLYTVEEGESSMEQPRPIPAFTSPGWRRKLGGSNSSAENLQSPFWPPLRGLRRVPGSPRGVGSRPGEHMGSNGSTSTGMADVPYTAIGWALTGNLNSNSTNLAWHYASGDHPNLDPHLGSLNPSDYETATGQVQNPQYPKQHGAAYASVQSTAAQERPGKVTHGFDSEGSPAARSDTEALRHALSPYSPAGSSLTPAGAMSTAYEPGLNAHLQVPSGGDAVLTGSIGHPYNPQDNSLGVLGGSLPLNLMPGDMMIESQDVDMMWDAQQEWLLWPQ